jgi:hypothetical protein
MRHSLCLRIAHLICLGSFVIALWGCAAHPLPAGHAGRQTLADLFRSRDPGTPTAPLVVRPLVFDRFQNRVQSFEFHTGVSGGELPVNFHLRSVPGALPGSDFAC